MKSMKPCTAAACSALWDVEKRSLLDRLSSLPDQLLIHILSLLPTKDAAAASVSSSRLRRLFPFITNLDFDVSSISLCANFPNAIEKYPTFVTFVTTVLQAYQSEYLTRFRLNVGSMDFRSRYFAGFGCCPGTGGGFNSKKHCLPDLKSLQLSEWISFPLTRCGLRELDLCILVREPGNAQLPPAIFTCQTLEVLKLEINIGLHQVLAMPSYSLPSLKLLFFSVSFICDDGFLPRLLASCPLLEDLKYQSFTEHVDHLIIQSTSLRRLHLWMNKVSTFQFDNSDFVYIDTPNLEHFEYTDNLARQYSIQINKHCLVKAKLFVRDMLRFKRLEASFQLLLNLIIPVSYVQHLHLSGPILRVLENAGAKVLKDKLPVFPKMKLLSLGGVMAVFWDKMLLPLLNSCPVLETLVFEGVVDVFDEIFDHPKEKMELEQKFFRTAHSIPTCCRHHLKTIEIQYFGKQREVEFIQFFLRHALVLENLIVHRFHAPHIPAPNKMLVESTLRGLLKASVNCSIQVL